MSPLAITSAELIRTEIRTRLPFKYGITTMVDVPHVFLRIRVSTPAGLFTGISGDHLPPKWFTKDPGRSVSAEIDDMVAVITHAGSVAYEIRAPSVFRFWRELWDAQAGWAREHDHPPLLAHFGTSLVERALLDAVARSQDSNLQQLIHGNQLGLSLGELHPELAGLAAGQLLPREIGETVLCRHTVGLADPLRDAEIADAVNDGLPQSLEASIRRYGLRHFKIKVDGLAPDVALERLRAVLAVLAAEAGPGMAFSLDGNESFPSVAALREFWQRLEGEPAIRPMLPHLLFVEQPLSRAIALDPVQGDLRTWPGRPPLIIDESDGDLGDLERALELGYAGTSHKNCKGVCKGIAHACLLAQRQAARPDERLILSGEDLCTIGPVALLQDLAVQAVLGVRSVERNGHHYFAGLSPWPLEIQQAVQANHPDLYEPAISGWPTLRIREGRISTASLVRAPLGVGGELPLDRIAGSVISLG